LGKFPLRTSNFSIFSLLAQKNLIGLGQKVPGSKAGWPLIYCGLKTNVIHGNNYMLKKHYMHPNYKENVKLSKLSSLIELKLFSKLFWIQGRYSIFFVNICIVECCKNLQRPQNVAITSMGFEKYILQHISNFFWIAKKPFSQLWPELFPPALL